MTFAAFKLFTWGTKTARTITVFAAALLGIWGYGKYTAYGVRSETIKEVVQKSNETARKRDKNIRKRRRRIKPGAARKRLRTEYPVPN